MKETFEPDNLVDEGAPRRTMECEQMMRLRTQQLDEKRRFLEYQNKLISELLAKRDEAKAKKREAYKRRIAELEEKVGSATILLDRR